MSPFVKSLVACLLLSVTVASAQECDESSFTLVRTCLFKSPIYNNILFPRNQTAYTNFCKGGRNNTYNCVTGVLEQCTDDAKFDKLKDLTVNLGKFSKGMQSFCSPAVDKLMNDKPQCMSNSFNMAEYTKCINNAIGKEINAGDVKDMKKQLDIDCDFFAAFSKCHLDAFKDDCQAFGTIYGSFIESGSYPYCMKSMVEREVAFQAYNHTSTASILGSSLTLFFTVAVLLRL